MIKRFVTYGVAGALLVIISCGENTSSGETEPDLTNDKLNVTPIYTPELAVDEQGTWGISGEDDDGITPHKNTYSSLRISLMTLNIF